MPENTEKRDYYDVLNVSNKASPVDIKSAYRHLAKKFHPDLCSDKDAEEKFKELSEAYEVLIDENKRKEYDQKGQKAVEATFGSKGFSWTKFTRYKDIEDIYHRSTFDTFLRKERVAARGTDIRVDLEISLEDCANGVKTAVVVPYTVSCNHCHGTGSEDLKFTICSYCKGEGQLKKVQGYGKTQIIDLVLCMNCEGTGKIVINKCKTCKGKGTSQEHKEVSIKVPAGADDGFRIRISGMGEKGANGGADGNLYVAVRLKPHSIFKLYGRDIHSNLSIKFTDAILGAEIPVKTIWGDSKIKIPPGTQPGEIFRLKEMGMPGSYGIGFHGDHIVRIIIGEIPKKLSAKQKKLIEEFAKLCEDTVQTKKHKKSFFLWNKE